MEWLDGMVRMMEMSMTRCHGYRTGNRPWKLAKHELQTWCDTRYLDCSSAHLSHLDLWGDSKGRGGGDPIVHFQVTKCTEVDQGFDATGECSQ